MALLVVPVAMGVPQAGAPLAMAVMEERAGQEVMEALPMWAG